jgi:hypothetical protein
MADLKISEMTYKQLAADDQFPTVNSSTLDNTKGLAGDIPLLVGISVYDSNAVYVPGHLVIYNTDTVSGIFRVKTLTTPGEAPEGIGFDKFESYGIGWRENTFSADVSNYFISIEGKRTGKITFTDALTVGDSILIVLTGDWVSGLNKNLIVTGNGTAVTMYAPGGESFTIEYLNSQINIYCKPDRSYSAGNFRLKFTLHG